MVLYGETWSAISVSAPTLRLWVTGYSTISFTPKRSPSKSFFPRKDISGAQFINKEEKKIIKKL